MKLSLPIFTVLTLCLSSAAPGAITIVAPTASTAGSLAVTEDVVFTATAAGGGITRIVLVGLNPVQDTGSTPSNIAPNLNYVFDGTPGSVDSTFSDNSVSIFSDLRPGDSQIVLSNGILITSIGQEFTLSSGNYTLEATADFNPLTTGTFTGEAFLANTAGIRLSNNVSVPEPGSASLIVLGAGLAFARRRKAK